MNNRLVNERALVLTLVRTPPTLYACRSQASESCYASATQMALLLSGVIQCTHISEIHKMDLGEILTRNWKNPAEVRQVSLNCEPSRAGWSNERVKKLVLVTIGDLHSAPAREYLFRSTPPRA